MSMASSTPPSEQMGTHLLINPFGKATLFYMDKEVASSSEATKYPVGTLDFKYLVRVNRNGSFDIQLKAIKPFNVTIETASKVCQVKVGADDLRVPPWYTVKGDTLIQKYTIKQVAEFAECHFRLKLDKSSLFRRVDVRYQQQSWATLVISQNQLLKMCLNASRELEIMQWACVKIIDRAKSRPDEVSAERLGLAAERVAKRNEEDNESVRSAVSTTNAETSPLLQRLIDNQQAASSAESQAKPELKKSPSDEWKDMPKLVPNSQADELRAIYVNQLEMALAALKLPMLPTPADSNK